jgi:rare lipoprotein A
MQKDGLAPLLLSLALVALTPSVAQAQETQAVAPPSLAAQDDSPFDDWPLEEELRCLQFGPDVPQAVLDQERAEEEKLREKEKEAREKQSLLDKLSTFAEKHRLKGTASYYSTFFDGRKTANGEIYRNARFSAAHLTLPLGCWVEVRSIATGRKIRLRVNDRGPYKGGFIIDLSQSAARALGVDRAEDRRVEVSVIALPGEEPPPEEDLDLDVKEEKALISAAAEN